LRLTSDRTQLDSVLLQDPDLLHLRRFRGGCWAVWEGEVGICLKGLPRSILLDVPGEFLPINNALKDVIFQDVEFRSMSFIRVELDFKSDRVIRKIVELSDLTEALIECELQEIEDIECDRLRNLLLESYMEFVSQFGLLSGYRKWFEGNDCFWLDYRAIAYALSLEIDDNPAPILTRRVNHPAASPIVQKFFEGSDGDRSEQAFRYWQARGNQDVDLDAISTIAGLDRDTVEFHLLDRRLCYRAIHVPSIDDHLDDFTKETKEAA
jgi:hypothetical protein